MACPIVRRLTSVNLRVEMLKDCEIVESVYTTNLGGALAGNATYNVRVETAPGSGVFEDDQTLTIAFDDTNADVETALEALTGITAATVTGLGTVVSPFIITFGDGKQIILEDADFSGLTTPTGEDFEQTTVGNYWHNLTAEATNFEYSLSDTATDATSINEYDEALLLTMASMSFSVDLYHASQDYLDTLRQDALYFQMRVFEEGRETGKTYFVFNGVKEEFSATFPKQEKVELSFSGRRSGALVVPFGTTIPVELVLA